MFYVRRDGDYKFWQQSTGAAETSTLAQYLLMVQVGVMQSHSSESLESCRATLVKQINVKITLFAFVPSFIQPFS